MNIKQINPNYPIFHTSFDIPRREEMVASVIEQHLQQKYDQGNLNFCLKKELWFDNLYQDHLNIATSLFGELQLHNSNSRNCWAYVNNKNFFKSSIHDHIRTSVIISVYYLSIPQTSSDDEGAICFYTFQNEEIFKFKPMTGDMIIFPYYFKHMPLQSHTCDYRIAINMEIKCNNVWGM